MIICTENSVEIKGSGEELRVEFCAIVHSLCLNGVMDKYLCLELTKHFAEEGSEEFKQNIIKDICDKKGVLCIV